MIRRFVGRIVRGYESEYGVDLPYLDDGLAPSVVADALEGREELLSPGVRAAFRFGQALGVGLDADEECAIIRSEWGDSALVEASVAPAYAVTFPIGKRGMGHAHAYDVRQLRLER